MTSTGLKGTICSLVAVAFVLVGCVGEGSITHSSRIQKRSSGNFKGDVGVRTDTFNQKTSSNQNTSSGGNSLVTSDPDTGYAPDTGIGREDTGEPVNHECEGASEWNGEECVPVCDEDEREEVDLSFPNCTGAPFMGKCGNYQACMDAAKKNGICSTKTAKAWCTRRCKSAGKPQWGQIQKQKVLKHCRGTVHFNKKNNTYYCYDPYTCEYYYAKTPLVLAFDADQRVNFTAASGSAEFDLSDEQDGSATVSDWPTAATPWLARDTNDDGRIESGRELFGSATLIDGATAQNGFEALSALDDNGDGRVDASDSNWSELVVWTDVNADRISQPTELATASEAGLEYLSLDYDVEPRCDERGNCEMERAEFGWRDESGELRTGAVVDVHLRVRADVEGPRCMLPARSTTASR